MKILLLTNKVPYPLRDGGTIATHNLVKGFAELNHNVTLLSLNTNKHYIHPELVVAALKNIADIHMVSINTDLNAYLALKNLLFSKLPYNAERFISNDFDQYLIELLKKTKFDVVQLEGLYMTPYIPTIRMYSSALISLRAHNIEHEIWERTAANHKNSLSKIYLKHLSGRIKQMKLTYLNKYDVLVPITTRDAEVYNKLGNDKPTLISPAGIFMPNLPEKKEIVFPSIFHIGALDWLPNQEGILWFLNFVWGSIKKIYPELKFYIAGRNASADFVKKLNTYDIIYCGEVENAHSFMMDKAIMIVPLLSGSGMRVKVIEGMALGKTIISTTIGAEGIDVTDKENIFIANTPEEFVSVIDFLIKNRPLFEQTGINAQNLIRNKYDNTILSKQLSDFYIKNLSLIKS